MGNEIPTSKAVNAIETADSGLPTSSEDSLVDPPAPDQQNMAFPDITSELLHSKNFTDSIGRGDEYLSESKYSRRWPATGKIYGQNKRLMISLPCRYARHEREDRVLNIFFLVDTGSPCSYLCQEAMMALLDDPTCAMPEQLSVFVNDDESSPLTFHMSPGGTTEAPRKFHDVNVLGMDFLELAELSMTVETFFKKFLLFKSAGGWDAYGDAYGDRESDYSGGWDAVGDLTRMDY